MTSLLEADRTGRQDEYSRTHVIEGFNLDGVELARLRRSRRGLPWTQIGLFTLAVLSLKIFLFFQMGAVGYGTMVDGLFHGGVLERVGGMLLTLDPVSEWVISLVHDPRF